MTREKVLTGIYRLASELNEKPLNAKYIDKAICNWNSNNPDNEIFSLIDENKIYIEDDYFEF